MTKRTESVYFPDPFRTSCEGADCSRIKLIPFRSVNLESISPAPAEADKERAQQEADLAMQRLKAGAYQTIVGLAEHGDLFGRVMLLLLRGTGGDAECKRAGGNCTCQPDLARRPEDKMLPPIRIDLPIELNGVKMTATFEIQMELLILPLRCRKTEQF